MDGQDLFSRSGAARFRGSAEDFGLAILRAA